MKTLVQIGIGALAIGALALVSGTPAEAKCSKYSAGAIGLTQGMAKELAKVNVDIIIAAEGAKAKGKAKYSCSGPVECKATQAACK